uniref:SGNH hydrolase-type esterase domain-containing protein n=1 Tax=Salix viminalis TaxID=40686 RepID=A0A6N2MB13_SALVM
MYFRRPTMATPSIAGVIFSLVLALSYAALQAEARVFFVFGDSLVDSGNNNYLATTARADSPPYGIDYPTHRPTGRFSNGLNIPDLISQRIGSKPVLPYLSPELRGQRLLQEYQRRARALIGVDQTERLVRGALVLITVGGNDFVNNYYLLPYSARSRQLSLPKYVRYLILEYRKILMKLHKLGASRVLVTGTGPMGCAPAELAMRGTNGGCSAELQRAASLYNPQLVGMLKGLNKKIGKTVFVAANTQQSHLDFIRLAMVLVAMVNRADGRAFFVFVDSGNNNYLATTARADSPPYGIDYPTQQATGRFSNGLNIPDIISEHIGSESPLPYLSPELREQRLLVGANFASAGIGILSDTGIQFINIIRMHSQLEYFQQYQQRVSALIGAEQAKRLVNQALVLITVGGNDFVNNYYLVPYSARSRQYDLPDYVKFLISEYRKLLLLATRSTNGGCSEELQRAAALYHAQLETMINDVNRKIGSNVFIGANTHQMHTDFISNPQAYGFSTSKIACCGQGPYNGVGLCTILSDLCPNRDLYAFWDSFHPSEKANRFIVQQMFTGSTQYMKPMNLSTILDLDSRS